MSYRSECIARIGNNTHLSHIDPLTYCGNPTNAYIDIGIGLFVLIAVNAAAYWYIKCKL